MFDWPRRHGERIVLKRLRIAVLLYLLLFIGATQYFMGRHATDWDAPLWVDVYLVAGDAHPATRRYLDVVSRQEFADVEEFLASEGKRYGLSLAQPFKLRVVGEHRGALPQLPADAGYLGVAAWSLRMRWLASRLQWASEGPSGDITAFAVFHQPAEGAPLDRSTALHKGLIVVANLFADRGATGTNEVVLAHELLHALRASDKYSPATNTPLYPHGYADPEARPLLPQTKAELMAGRIPLDEHRSGMPSDLRDVVIGPATAREIGWPIRR
jgi:hypothetical protein